jgi:hypothetical protein
MFSVIKPCCVVILVLFAGAGTLSAQGVFRPGYYVATDLDTVRGEIQLVGNAYFPTGFNFRPSRGETRQSGVLEVAFGMYGYRHFKRIAVGDSSFYAQALVRGKVDLFGGHDRFFIGRGDNVQELKMEVNTIDIADPSTGKSIQRVFHKKTYLGTLNLFLTGCDQVSDQINRTTFNEPQLTKLVKKYNECVDQSSTYEYKEKLPIIRLEAGVIVGAVFIDHDFSISDQVRDYFIFFENLDMGTMKIVPGALVSISSPKLSNRIHLQLEVRHFSYSGKRTVSIPGRTWDEADIYLAYKSLVLPISLAYEIPLSINSSMFFRLGLVKTFLSGRQLYAVEYLSTDHSYTQTKDFIDKFESGQIGPMAGVGFNRRVGNVKLGIEARYENTSGMLNLGAMGVSNNMFSTSISLSYVKH